MRTCVVLKRPTLHTDTKWTLTDSWEEESADLCVRSMPAGDSGSHIIAGHKDCCANILYTYFRDFLANYYAQ